MANNTTYYVRAYARNSEGYSYGGQVSFTTLVAFPTVSTQSVSSITNSTASGNGNITNVGGQNADERGFVYSTSSQSDPGNTAPGSSTYSNFENETGSFGTGSFSLGLSDLSGDTTYYVRAYAHNSRGYSYGGQVSFTTEPDPITVVTQRASGITETEADLNGEITDTAGENADERGFVYSTSSQSEPGDTAPASSSYSSVENETGSFGVGSFSLPATGLTANTVYYVRAYAHNSRGYSYGDEMYFTPGSRGFGEAGTIATVGDGTWSTLNFNSSYENPIVVGTTNSDNNGNGLIFEARNVTEASAEVRICKALGSSGTGCDPAATSTETAGYLVLSANRLNQSNILGVEGETVSLSGGESGAQSVSFNKSYAQAPYVFASVQTSNGNDGVEAKIDSVTTTGFNISLCEPNGDTCDTTHVTEKVAWIAIEPGNVPWEQTGETGEVSHGGGDTWSAVSFSETYTSAPTVIAKQQTENGADDGEISEARNVTTSGAEVRFCELDAAGVCGSHPDEDVAWLAVATGDLSVGLPSVSTDSISDVSTSAATANGFIVSLGGEAESDERGFVFSTSSQAYPGDTAPAGTTYDNTIIQSGSFGTGSFTGSLSSLVSMTLYYVRAYMHTAEGYVYGNEISFITNAVLSDVISGISTQLRGGTTIRGGSIIR
ncbi:MAG: H-type lectin domain-containing protein [Candidatus Paceibacterota bacterium]